MLEGHVDQPRGGLYGECSVEQPLLGVPLQRGDDMGRPESPSKALSQSSGPMKGPRGLKRFKMALRKERGGQWSYL